MPYYFYMCDMIPFSEHWRVSVADAQRLQHPIMGYLPGLRDAADRLRRAVRRQALGAPARRLRHRARHLLLDQELPHLDRGRPTPRRCRATYEYYDPIHTLPEAGQQWWAEHGNLDESALKAAEVAEASRRTAALQAY